MADSDQRVADLHRQARQDYGTAAERQQRESDARGQLAEARTAGNEAAGTPGRRS